MNEEKHKKERIEYIADKISPYTVAGCDEDLAEAIFNLVEEENARLKDKLKDIEKILDTDCCVENIYKAICQYLNLHDFELDLEDYLKEN